MMQNAQKGMTKWVVRALLALLILSFAMWGVADYVTAPVNPPVAHVGDREIRSNAFINEAQRRIQAVRRQQNRPIDTQTAIAAGLYAQTLSALIDRNALLAQAEDWNLGVSDQAVAAAIQSDPAFQGPAGNFDRIRFDTIMRNAGFSEQQFIESLREDMINRQIESTITAGLQDGQDPLARAILAYQLEARDVSFIEIANDQLASASEPAEDELKTFHQDNPQLFSSPERRSAKVLHITAQDLTGDLVIDERPIQTAYESRIAEFTTAGTRAVKQAIFQTEETASAAMARINEGVTFETVVQEATGAAPIDLGVVRSGELPGEVGDAAFAAEANTVTGPVESTFGWHLIQVGDVTEEVVQPLDEVRETIISDLKLEEAQYRLVEFSNRIEDELAGGGRVADVAVALEMQAEDLPPVDRAGRTAEGDAVAADLPPEALQILFGTQPGDELIAQELDDGSLLLVEPLTIAEPALRPFDEVRDDVAGAWKRQKLAELAATERARLMERIQGGATLAEIAAELEVEIETVEGITRQSGAPSLAGEARQAAFSASAGEAVSGAAPTDGSQLIATVDAIKPAEIDEDDAQVGVLTRTIGEAFAEDLMSQYLEALREDVGYSIMEPAYRQAVDPNNIYLN
ncbi:SurA N-terminal domain-containing protein [Minwuia sp.]|uniref:SurA N-terminal domain-containing protein n=1 Tax=Minwuia sp. TaxID=2493630 RepID=UPI003A8FBD80